ncbi:MAG: hypothetical protein ACOX3G_07490 [Armatimonadota bacterium]
MHFWKYLGLIMLLATMGLVAPAEGKQLHLNFVCSDNNDLYKAAVDSGCKCFRFDTAAEAIDKSASGGAVLVLADGYPDERTAVDVPTFEAAKARGVRLYVEYPSALPGVEMGDVKGIVWERGVVATREFGDKLPELRILSISGCRFIHTHADNPLLVIARVAGFDSAVYGIPDSAQPILFRLPGYDALIATTKLSGFITGRYAPADDWATLWERIFKLLDSSVEVQLKWKKSVHPAYGPDDKLPNDVERRALKEAAGWYLNSRLLVSQGEKPQIDQWLLGGGEDVPVLGPDAPVGDGSYGILEGYAAGIDYNGDQRRRLPLRADCNCEVAMALAAYGDVNSDSRAKTVAKNLLRYVYVDSGMCRGERANPKHPAFGLIAWGDISPAWMRANYGDDNARVLLATMLAQACLGINDWDEHIMRALLANLRTTGKLGFRSDRIDIPNLEANGWKHYHDAETINYAPHFESYLWACNIWAYKHTGYKPFLENTKNAIRMTMDVFPSGWRWQDTIERARMLLCLAWLIQVEDTLEHRGWLKTITDDLRAKQQNCGAIPELLGGMGGGHYHIPASNEAYGTGETPLIQNNGDPATDQLYTTGFALLGLHEAYAATGDKDIKEIEDKLAQYLCRIQVKSKQFPYLNGSWFRAFDYKRWDYWASSADAGWGAWSLETGWGPAWITAILGLRAKDVSMWDITSSTRIADHFRTVKTQLAENDGAPWISE